jgi:predicted Zn-dependent protease
MAEKSPRRLKLEQAVAEDPSDAFLRYGLAMQCLREGDVDEGRRRLRDLIAEQPEADEVVAAYQQLGQSQMEAGEVGEARAAFRAGIDLAKARGNGHAQAEMEGLLAQLG